MTKSVIVGKMGMAMYDRNDVERKQEDVIFNEETRPGI